MTPRIMVIESEIHSLSIIEHALNVAGHNFFVTRRSAEAAELFELFQPEIIVMDIVMPDGDSIDQIDDFRYSSPSVKIIGISSNSFLLKLARQHGAEYVLQKPFGPKEIDELVSRVLDPSYRSTGGRHYKVSGLEDRLCYA